MNKELTKLTEEEVKELSPLIKFRILVENYQDVSPEFLSEDDIAWINEIEEVLKDYDILKNKYERLSEQYKKLYAEYEKKELSGGECSGCPAFGQTYRAGESPCHVCPAGRKKGF